jgi:hypothetical protein
MLYCLYVNPIIYLPIYLCIYYLSIYLSISTWKTKPCRVRRRPLVCFFLLLLLPTYLLLPTVWDAIQELEVPGLSKEYNAKRSRKKKQDNHHSDRIFVEAYKAIKNELYAFTKVGQSTFKNDEYIVARLAAGQRPSFEKPVAHAVETIESTESRKRRMHNDQLLNLQEQMLQHRWRIAFHTLYHELKKYRRYVRVDEELKKMETLMHRAQEKFDGPSVLVRTLSMGRKAVKRCLSPKCKRAKRFKPE